MEPASLNNKLEDVVSEIRESWKSLSMDSILRIQSAVESLAQEADSMGFHLNGDKDLFAGLKLHQDEAYGFILSLYSERRGNYRIPHDHGRAWVVYAIVSGEVEMGNYFKVSHSDGLTHLILRDRGILSAGTSRIYTPGEIHDTRCISESAVILRLTSRDLRLEEQSGYMTRFEV